MYLQAYGRIVKTVGLFYMQNNLLKSLHVCDGCGHHHRIDALTRLKQLNGGGDYRLLGEEINRKTLPNL